MRVAGSACSALACMMHRVGKCICCEKSLQHQAFQKSKPTASWLHQLCGRPSIRGMPARQCHASFQVTRHAVQRKKIHTFQRLHREPPEAAARRHTVHQSCASCLGVRGNCAACGLGCGQVFSYSWPRLYQGLLQDVPGG